MKRFLSRLFGVSRPAAGSDLPVPFRLPLSGAGESQRLDRIESQLGRTGERLAALDRIESQLRRTNTQLDFLRNHGSSYLGDGIALTHLPDETPIFINSNDQGSPLNFLNGGRYEEDNRAVLLSFLKDDSVFVDVGANLGYFSLQVAQRLHPAHGRVHAFEPQERMAELMQRTLHLNGLRDLVRVHRLALSDVAGETELEVPVTHAGGAQIVTELTQRWAKPEAMVFERQTVKLAVFDELMPADFRCDLVKIDVEGHELPVLLGMRRTLERSPDVTVLFEKMVRQFGDERELWSYFSGLGMRLFGVFDGGWLRPFASPEALMDWDRGYVVASRRDDLVTERDRRRFRIGPRQMHTATEARWSGEGADRMLEVGGTEVLAFGPYWSLPRGDWRFVVDGDWDRPIEAILKERLGQVEVGRWRLEPGQREFAFGTPQELVKFECVLHALDRQPTTLRLRGIDARQRGGGDPGDAPLEAPKVERPVVLPLPEVPMPAAHVADPRRPGLRMAILSNCQGQVVSSVIQALLGGRSPPVHAISQVGLDDPAQLLGPLRELARHHDRLLMQPVAARQVLPLVPELEGRIELFPSLIFPAFHPDICYVYRRGKSEYLQGPLGPYHSSIAYHAWRIGMSAREAVEHFRGEVYEALQFHDYWASSTRHLLDEGRDAGLPLDGLLERWRLGGCFMHTHNHPRRGPLIDITRALLDRLGLEAPQPDSEEFVHDPLASSEIWPVYPEIAARLGVAGSLVFKASNGNQEVRSAVHLLDLETFVKQSYASYEAAGREALTSDRPYSARYAAVFGTPSPPVPAVVAGATAAHPYRGLPERQFWRQAVAPAPETVDPVLPRLELRPETRIATAGSCFAQHIARALRRRGIAPIDVEPAPSALSAAEAQARQYGVYSARYGNLYTARQLLQLLQRATGRFEPREPAWQRPDGRWADPFRPEIEPQGFETPEALLADRHAHLVTVRTLFEHTELFVFTLGLTEAWTSREDGAVFPLAPGVVAGAYDPVHHAFVNFDVAEVRDDLLAFIDGLRALNPAVKLLFTVSPVPLAATFENRHVLTATVHSKSVLRAAVDAVLALRPDCDYFPAYELVAGPQAGAASFGSDGRSVTPGTVDRVMRLFFEHYLPGAPEPEPQQELLDEALRLNRLFCEEDRLARD